MDSEIYLLLTEQRELVAKGLLESGSSETSMQLQIVEGDAEAVENCEHLCVLGSEPGEMPVMCQVVRRREDRVVLKKIMSLNPDLRRSYRVPAHFDSFLYPVSGSWRGRMSMKATDMSCGGIAFCTEGSLRIDEVAQIVISNLQNPVLVNVQVLRREPVGNGQIRYCTKFINLCPQEDQQVCRAVFSLQISSRNSGT